MAIDALGFIVKFADDSKAGRVVDTAEDQDAFQDMLNRLETWSQEWQLLFNRGKCKVMYFGKKNTRKEYTMGGHILEASKQEKDQWVLIDDSLKPSMCQGSFKSKHGVGSADKRMHMEGSSQPNQAVPSLCKTTLRICPG